MQITGGLLSPLFMAAPVNRGSFVLAGKSRESHLKKAPAGGSIIWRTAGRSFRKLLFCRSSQKLGLQIRKTGAGGLDEYPRAWMALFGGSLNGPTTRKPHRDGGRLPWPPVSPERPALAEATASAGDQWRAIGALTDQCR
jgi:hypothetical protein